MSLMRFAKCYCHDHFIPLSSVPLFPLPGYIISMMQGWDLVPAMIWWLFLAAYAKNYRVVLYPRDTS
jgi:hypothetical protein